MRQKSVHPESPSERIVKNIRRATRKRLSSEEKIRIVLDGLRGESSIAELCRREGIAERSPAMTAPSPYGRPRRCLTLSARCSRRRVIMLRRPIGPDYAQ
jgi:hypothetical protein